MTDTKLPKYNVLFRCSYFPYEIEELKKFIAYVLVK